MTSPLFGERCKNESYCTAATVTLKLPENPSKPGAKLRCKS
jgi:hypothetical protein